MLDQTLKRLEEINLIRDTGGYEAKVISPPGQGYKVAPVAWQIFAGGLFLGLLGGAGLAYLLDVSDRSFRAPEEIRRRLGLPVVGHIPFLSPADQLGRVKGPAAGPAPSTPRWAATTAPTPLRPRPTAASAPRCSSAPRARSTS